MVIRTGPGRLAQERRVDVRHLRQRAGCAVGEEGIARAADRDVLSAPERQRRHVAEVVAASSPRAARRSQIVGRVERSSVLLIRSVWPACWYTRFGKVGAMIAQK